MLIKRDIEIFSRIVSLSTQVKMQYRICSPFSLQLFQCQPAEKVFPSAHICFNGGHEQAFPEAPRAAQEVIFARRNKPVYQFSLVHIDITSVSEVLKILDSDRVQHKILFCSH